jgi:hypothetical protein
MGRADGWLHGKAEVREYYAVGLRAPRLHFELVDVLLGVKAICMIFSRETGVMMMSDLFELDGSEPLSGRLTNRLCVTNLVVDQEIVTRTFSAGPGEIDVIAIYEVEHGKIANCVVRLAHGVDLERT